ncbi:NPC intracellular cholesterol transporter 2 [Tetranychus urticae]|uniref:MD-2-related lipid-recognition domain-containing protein n=1 Tax=Tetranychus urticae TaxID=32264 RepID=T1KLD5_TETUR|nr:NPC intracellular cholesterol transporter 2 [Tetranychus urticae]
MIRNIIALTLFIAYVQARNTTFTNCSEKGVIKFVNVEPCDSDPCTFTSGQEVHLNGVLVSPAASNSPQLKVTVKVAGIYFNYPGVSSDACDYLSCPLEADVDTPFALSLKVLSLPLPLETQIRFQLLDSDGSELNCGETTVRVE